MSRSSAQTLAGRLLRLVSFLVPSADRGTWLEEWQAELWVFERRAPSLGSLSLVAGSIPHALWERKEWTMEVLFQDVRFAFRQLRRSPSFTLVAVLTLAVGVGATTTIFSLVNATLLRPPAAITRADEVIQIGRDRDDQGFDNLGYLHLLNFRDNADSLESVAAYAARALTIGRGDAIQIRTGQLVTGDYFRVVGVGALTGRVLQPADDVDKGAHPVVVISEPYWREALGSDPTAVGSTLFINGTDYTIVGITAPGFRGTDVVGSPTDAWLPLMMAPTLLGEGYDEFDRPGFSWLWMIGRLRPGVSAEQARAQLDALWHSKMVEFWGEEPSASTRIGVVSGVGLRPEEREAIAQILALMMGVVAMVLVITCANVASLMLARGATRTTELGVRAALGAGTRRLVRQMLTESLVIALAGGGLATVISYWSARAFPALLPWSLGVTPRPDFTVLGFALLLSLVTGLTFGLMPAIRAARRDTSTVLREGQRLSGHESLWLRNGLVVLQVALSFVLLGTTGLMLRSLSAADRAQPGFATTDVISASVNLDIAGYDEPAGRAFYRELLTQAQALPGVEAAALGMGRPFGGWARRSVTLPEPGPNGEEFREIDYATVSAGWFDTLRVQMVEGGGFADQLPGDDQPSAVVLSESAARLLFPGGDPIGQTLTQGPEEPGLRVVGIVPDLQYRSLRSAPGPALYQFDESRYSGRMTLFVRAPAVDDTRAALRNLITRLDPDLGVPAITTLHERMLLSLGDTRAVAQLAALVAIVAIFLAAIGLYGVVSFATATRTPEIGLRIALGAEANSVRLLVLRRGLGLTAIGIGVGIAATLAVGGLLSSLLYGISPRDPGALVVATAGLSLIAAAAAYLPARRATRVDPVTALRQD